MNWKEYAPPILLLTAFGVGFLYLNSAIAGNTKDIGILDGGVKHLATKEDIARVEGKLDTLIQFYTNGE